MASDVHYFRENNLKKAFDFVAKKFGADVADLVFNKNALQIING